MTPRCSAMYPALDQVNPPEDVQPDPDKGEHFYCLCDATTACRRRLRADLEHDVMRCVECGLPDPRRPCRCC